MATAIATKKKPLPSPIEKAAPVFSTWRRRSTPGMKGAVSPVFGSALLTQAFTIWSKMTATAAIARKSVILVLRPAFAIHPPSS